jgi:hypothetical protein
MAVCRTEFQTFFELCDDIRIKYVTCYNEIDYKTLTISDDTELTLDSTKSVTCPYFILQLLLAGLQLGPVHISRHSYAPSIEATII